MLLSEGTQAWLRATGQVQWTINVLQKLGLSRLTVPLPRAGL